MNRIIELSNRAYAVVLRSYPREIRQRWEHEMSDTFATQISDGWNERGTVAVIRIWSIALAEVFCIALPPRFARSALLVPLFSLASTAGIFYSLFWAFRNPLALNQLGESLFHKLGG